MDVIKYSNNVICKLGNTDESSEYRELGFIMNSSGVNLTSVSV